MRAKLLGGLGALLTAVTAGAVFAPDLFAAQLSAVAAALESTDTNRLLLALGVVVGLYSAWTARSGSDPRPPTDGPSARFARVGDPPEDVTAEDRARTGRSFDRRIAAATDGDAAATKAVRSTLAETAAEVHARAADRSPESARRAVETGAWTDDPTAAAFLAGEDGPDFSLVARLREWLDPQAERRRRIERTVSAVESALDGEGGGPNAAETGGESA